MRVIYRLFVGGVIGQRAISNDFRGDAAGSAGHTGGHRRRQLSGGRQGVVHHRAGAHLRRGIYTVKIRRCGNPFCMGWIFTNNDRLGGVL